MRSPARNRRGDHATGSRKHTRISTSPGAGAAAQVQPLCAGREFHNLARSSQDNAPRDRTTAPDPEGIQPEILTRPGTRTREDPTVKNTPAPNKKQSPPYRKAAAGAVENRRGLVRLNWIIHKANSFPHSPASRLCFRHKE